MPDKKKEKAAPPMWDRLRKDSRRFALVILVGALLEVGASSAFVAKRMISQQPFPGLLEQYFALGPFVNFFDDQYVYPPRWKNIYIGDIENPRTARIWWVGDHLLGHRLAPNVLVTESGWSYRQTNSQGFIVSDPESPTYSAEPAEGTFRIIILGGSTVEGNGSSGSLQALPAQLLSNLRERYVPTGPSFVNFEVINAGVSGFTSINEYLYYVSELRHFNPHLVISYNGWNDQQLQPRTIASLGERAPYFYTDETAAYPSIINDHFRWAPSMQNALVRTAQEVVGFLRGFAIIDMPLRLLQKALKRFDVVGQYTPTPYSHLGPIRYVDNIELLKFIVERDGASYAWFVQPLVGIGNHPPSEFREKSYLENYPEEVAKRRAFYESAASLQGEVLRRHSQVQAGFCTAVLTDVFDENPAQVYDDSGHLNDTGNGIVAERIAWELARCGAIALRPR